MRPLRRPIGPETGRLRAATCVTMILLVLLLAVTVMPFGFGLVAGSQADPVARLIFMALAPAIPAILIGLMWIGDGMGGDGRLGTMIAVELAPVLIAAAWGLAWIGKRLTTRSGHRPRE